MSGSDACIVDAASSGLNKIFIEVAKDQGIDIINIVRR